MERQRRGACISTAFKNRFSGSIFKPGEEITALLTTAAKGHSTLCFQAVTFNAYYGNLQIMKTLTFTL